MTWFRLDDQCSFGAKVLKAGDEAFGMWCRAGCWSSGALTDGFIPDHIAKKLGRKSLWFSLESCGESGQKGLVERVENGWQIHDFLDWNLSAENVRKHREKNNKKVSAWRAKHPPCNPVTNQVGNSNVTGPCNPSPVPSRPVPSDLPSVDSEKSAPAAPLAPPPVAKGKRARKPQITMPANWAPTDRNYRKGESRGFDRSRVDHEAELFRLKSEAKSWAYADWAAAFDNWLVSEFTPDVRQGFSSASEAGPSIGDRRAKQTALALETRGNGALKPREQAAQAAEAASMLAMIGNGGI